MRTLSDLMNVRDAIEGELHNIDWVEGVRTEVAFDGTIAGMCIEVAIGEGAPETSEETLPHLAAVSDKYRGDSSVVGWSPIRAQYGRFDYVLDLSWINDSPPPRSPSPIPPDVS